MNNSNSTGWFLAKCWPWPLKRANKRGQGPAYKRWGNPGGSDPISMDLP